MNDKPIVTVITVVYNLIKAARENCFRQCVESVRGQSYQNIEHIIVDGGSTDGTVDLIKEYGDKGWVKYISEPDDGLYDAMNKGAALASGKYLAFLNSDDFYFDLSGIEKCVEKLIKTNSDFSYARTNITGGKEKNNNNHLYLKPDLLRVYTDMPFSHQSMIVKKEVFERLGMHDLAYKCASDYDFILKMVLGGCSHVFCDCYLASFRLGGFSLKNADLSHNEIASFYQKHYKKYFKMSHYTAKKAYLLKILPIKTIAGILPNLSLNEKISFLSFQLKSRLTAIFTLKFLTFEKRLRSQKSA